MRKFHQIFWIFLPATIYGLFWVFWSFVLQRPVPVVGKFLWNSGSALKKIMPNLQNPYDQFIYFPEASRWWDVGFAPLGALALVLLYYNKKFNNDSYAYEDVSFSWRKLASDITTPYLRPYYMWKERRHETEVARSMAEAEKIHKKSVINDVDAKALEAHLIRMHREVKRISEQIEKSHIEMSYPRMEGIKTVMVYCLIICFFLGAFFGFLVGPAKGPFGFFAIHPIMSCFVSLLMLLSRRWQIAAMTHMACWVGTAYGFSIGIGMIPALVWTSYMFVPTGLVIVLIHFFRSRRKMEKSLALL